MGSLVESAAPRTNDSLAVFSLRIVLFQDIERVDGRFCRDSFSLEIGVGVDSGSVQNRAVSSDWCPEIELKPLFR